jgi:signal peptidase I
MNQNETPKKSLKKEALELLRFTLIVLAVVVPLRVFVAQPFIVSGESMVPTFENGDYLIVDQISYYRNDPERGDVIVFRYPTNHKRFLIKRVIGLPGEMITINGNKITINKTDGSFVQLDESYINEEFSTYGTWELGEEDYFVLGDNRQKSSDSRSWGILDKDLIVGKTFLRLFPVNHINYQPGELQPEEFEIIINNA